MNVSFEAVIDEVHAKLDDPSRNISSECLSTTIAAILYCFISSSQSLIVIKYTG